MKLSAGENDNTYTYDADLKRIKKNVDGTIQKFIYDGANVVAEYNAENTLQASYITASLDENLSIKRASNTYYYHQDGLGSIRNITDSSQVAQNTYDYYAFGLVIGTPTENISNDYRFTGRRYDSESGLHYYRLRYYDVKSGRFTTTDPIYISLVMAKNARTRAIEAFRNLLPLYAYVGSNPLGFVDPFGLSASESGSDSYAESMDAAKEELERCLRKAGGRLNRNIYDIIDMFELWDAWQNLADRIVDAEIMLGTTAITLPIGAAIQAYGASTIWGQLGTMGRWPFVSPSQMITAADRGWFVMRTIAAAEVATSYAASKVGSRIRDYLDRMSRSKVPPAFCGAIEMSFKLFEKDVKKCLREFEDAVKDCGEK